ncbi:MAG: glycosyltransferase family 4 protein, partial [Erysipelotrichia bacterium]|nr:glycosyltransferase family 4 protein [Erysipelotrichia bacterium]
MRIGIFTDTYVPDINGVVSSIYTLQKGLEAAGHEVYIITSHKGFIHAKREGNVFRMPGLELKWLYGYILSTPYHFTLKAEIEKLNLDVIHVHTEFGVGIFGRIVAKSLNLPVVYTYHTMYEDYTHYINKFDLDSVEKVSKKVFTTFSKYLCESVAAIIAPSEKTKEKLQSYGVKRPIYIIPTGLDLIRFKEESVPLEKRLEIRKQYGIGEDEKLITYIGRIAEEKSIDIIVDGVPYIQNEKCRLMIVGGGPQLEDLKAQAAKLKVSDRIIFTGPIPREEVPAYYLSSDCFVSASTSETQGMTFIESLASGLCVLARPDEVLEHLVIEEETGFYFNTPEQFAQKVEQYVSMNEQSQMKMKQQAREVVKPYEVNTFVKHVVDVYKIAMEEYKDSYIIKSIKSSNDYMKLYLDSAKNNGEETLMISLDDYMLY